MNHFFVARRSAIAMLIAEMNVWDDSGSDLSPEVAARVSECQRLLVDVRAGRIDEFVLPAATPIQLTVLD